MRNTIIYFLLLVITVSCDDFTEVELPNSQLTAPAVFNSDATANAAMVDIYSKMRDSGLLTGSITGLSNQLALYSDELDFYGSPGSLCFNFAQNSLQPAGTEILELWNSTYSQIYAANSVIEGVSSSTGMTDAIKARLTGEALFVRGTLHFYLALLYGDVPYIKTTDYLVNQSVLRTAYTEVLNQALEDLAHAKQLLPADYVTSERTRPNRYTASAMLARINLYLGKWQEAEEAANEVISGQLLYTLPGDLDQSYLKDAPSTLWQFAPSMPGNNTQQATTFSFQAGPPPLSALSHDFLESFETGDLRRSLWVKEVTNDTGSWSHIFKYKNPANTGSSSEYSIIIALSEQFLIRAEARVHTGNMNGARSDINRIRNRAGLPDTNADAVEELLQAILKERRIELACEFGHRFFDLKRANMLDTKLTPAKPGWDSHDALLPIPDRELLINTSLLPQNNGY